MGKCIDDNISEQDLIREFMNIAIESQTLQPNETTVKAVSEYMDISEASATWLLKKLVQQKILKIRKINMNAHIINAYSPRNGSWEDAIESFKHKE